MNEKNPFDEYENNVSISQDYYQYKKRKIMQNNFLNAIYTFNQ